MIDVEIETEILRVRAAAPDLLGRMEADRPQAKQEASRGPAVSPTWVAEFAGPV